LPIETASTARIEADPALLSEFITKALGFGADDPVFISDESCLCDFGDDGTYQRCCPRVMPC
jgi:hypothetical protein